MKTPLAGHKRLYIKSMKHAGGDYSYSVACECGWSRFCNSPARRQSAVDAHQYHKDDVVWLAGHCAKCRAEIDDGPGLCADCAAKDLNGLRYTHSTVTEVVDGQRLRVFRRTLHRPTCRYGTSGIVLTGSMLALAERHGGDLVVNAEEWPSQSRFVGCKVCGTTAIFEEAS